MGRTVFLSKLPQHVYGFGDLVINLSRDSRMPAYGARGILLGARSAYAADVLWLDLPPKMVEAYRELGGWMPYWDRDEFRLIAKRGTFDIEIPDWAAPRIARETAEHDRLVEQRPWMR